MGEKGMRLAEQVGSERFVARARQFRGIARCELGDFGGLDDLSEALRVAVEQWTRESGRLQQLRVLGVADLRGGRGAAGLSRGHRLRPPARRQQDGDLDHRGEHLAALRPRRVGRGARHGRADRGGCAVRGAGQSLLIGRTSKARVLYYRGDVGAAAEISADVLPRARDAGDPQIVMPALAVAIVMETDPERVRALAEELLAVDFVTDPHTARACIHVGALDIAERMAILDERASPRTHHAAATVQAMLAEARGERDEAGRRYAEAAQRWLDHPAALERGLCLLGVARTTGDAAAAQDASAIFRSLGAHSLAGEAAAAAA